MRLLVDTHVVVWAAADPRAAIHADPFDRMLVAQARVDGLTLATADPLVRRYPVRLFPVGAPAR